MIIKNIKIQKQVTNHGFRRVLKILHILKPMVSSGNLAKIRTLEQTIGRIESEMISGGYSEEEKTVVIDKLNKFVESIQKIEEQREKFVFSREKRALQNQNFDTELSELNTSLMEFEGEVKDFLGERYKVRMKPKEVIQAYQSAQVSRLSKVSDGASRATSIDDYEQDIENVGDYTVQGDLYRVGNAKQVLTERAGRIWGPSYLHRQEDTREQWGKDLARSSLNLGGKVFKALTENNGKKLEKQTGFREMGEFLRDKGIKEDDLEKVRDFILSKITQTNTDMDMQGAIALGYGNPNLTSPGSETYVVTNPYGEINGKINPAIFVQDGEIVLNLGTACSIKKVDFSENDDNRELASVYVDYKLAVSIEDIVSGNTDGYVPKLTVHRMTDQEVAEKLK